MAGSKNLRHFPRDKINEKHATFLTHSPPAFQQACVVRLCFLRVVSQPTRFLICRGRKGVFKKTVSRHIVAGRIFFCRWTVCGQCRLAHRFKNIFRCRATLSREINFSLPIKCLRAMSLGS